MRLFCYFELNDKKVISERMKTMRSICYTPTGLQLIEKPEPQITRQEDVKIKISYCGICGSDLHIVRKEMDHYFGGVESVAMGHEATGIITELGPAATAKGLKIGDKVTYYYNEHCGNCHYCRNGQEQFCTSMNVNMSAMSEYIVVGEQSVYKLDDNVNMSKAILIEPISVCLRGIDLAQIKPGQTVAISGGGPIGLITMMLAKASGASELTLIEPIEKKRKVALELGAKHVLDPITQDVVVEGMEITSGRGFDVVIEASGAVQACPTAYNLVGRGGTLEFLAALYHVDYNFPLNLQDAFFKEIKIIAGVYQSPYTFPRSVRLFDQLNLESLFVDNCIFDVENFEQAFESQMTGKTIKSVIKFAKD